MKERKKLRAVTSVPALLLVLSCVPGEEFDLPKSGIIEEVVLETNSDLDAVVNAFFQNPEEVTSFEDEQIMEAYVVSSDESGNFYKELILQDKPENPTAGIAVQINQASYFETFDLGRKVYLKVKGLSIGEMNGVLALGLANGKQIDPIPLARISDYIVRTIEVAEITPLPLNVMEFSDRTENLYIKVEEVQFSKFLINQENPFTFASEANDEFDGERQIESCSGDFPFILSTSTFSNFKSLELPQGSGSLQGILTRDFYDDFFTVYLNHPVDIQFTNDSRCDPEVLDCGLAGRIGNRILFEEDFETYKTNSPIEGNGWTNLVQEGSVTWEAYTSTGENASLGNSARVQTSGSGDYKTESWLITPLLNFDLQPREVLEFKTSTSFANHSLLEVLYSNNWDGTPENFYRANWRILSSAYVAQSADHFGDWLSSGRVNLGCATGKGYIAFKYSGSDVAYFDGIYELDDVKITSD